MPTVTKFVLHNYWRSSASQRVRTAFGLKGLEFEYVAVNITAAGGAQQLEDAYRVRNPSRQVPALELTFDNGTTRTLTQSLPIMEWLDDVYPTPPILPEDPYLRARARALAEIINSGVQPFQNLTTGSRIRELGGDDKAWVKPFMTDGLIAYAAACADVAGDFSVGDHPTIADCCLIPQLATSRRYGIDLAPFQKLLAIETRCLALPSFAAATPERQVDAVVH
jgi:maleylpyruvate isomerase